jgi:small subunit ribosomal protein S4e
LSFIELKKEEMYKKPAKIIGKRIIKGGKSQINLYDGKNLIMNSKDAKPISVGDTLIINLKENKIENHIKLEKGALVFVVGGKHQGEKGKIISIDGKIIVKNEKEFEVAKQNIFVIEK